MSGIAATVAPTPSAPAPSLTAACILMAGRYHADAYSRLVVASIRRARRYTLSYAAEELIALLPFWRWARAVAHPMLLPDDPPIWVERPLRPLEIPEQPFAVGGIGALLSAPPCRGANWGTAAVSVLVTREPHGDGFRCTPYDHLCPLNRGPAVSDLAAAFPLMLRGILRPVPAPPVVSGQEELDWMLVPVGSGSA